MQSKLASYQAFMAEYIVNAQTQKLLAVKEAELKAEKKFQERLEKLFEASGATLPAEAAAAPAAAAPAVEESLFQKRNAQVVAAGAKSRWGAMEVEKAAEQLKSAPVAAAAAPSPPEEVAATIFEQRNAQVAAAGANSRWGSMEVERAAAGVGSAVATAPVKEEKTVATVTLADRVNLGARLLGV